MPDKINGFYHWGYSKTTTEEKIPQPAIPNHGWITAAEELNLFKDLSKE